MTGEWRDEALCRGTPITWWFPREGPGRGSDIGVPAVTRIYCDACPVRAECRTYALHHEHYGVWAATSMRQRDRIRSRSRIAVVTPGVTWHPPRDPTDDELALIEAEADERTAV